MIVSLPVCFNNNNCNKQLYSCVSSSRVRINVIFNPLKLCVFYGFFSFLCTSRAYKKNKSKKPASINKFNYTFKHISEAKELTLLSSSILNAFELKGFSLSKNRKCFFLRFFSFLLAENLIKSQPPLLAKGMIGRQN